MAKRKRWRLYFRERSGELDTDIILTAQDSDNVKRAIAGQHGVGIFTLNDVEDGSEHLIQLDCLCSIVILNEDEES